MHNELAVTANLLGEPARAAILLNLMSGRALPAGELALAANISSADSKRSPSQAP
jgi:hypothetical protein